MAITSESRASAGDFFFEKEGQMIWIWLFFVFWFPTLVLAVAIDGRACFLGLHDLGIEYVDGRSPFMPKNIVFKCKRCGKVMQ